VRPPVRGCSTRAPSPGSVPAYFQIAIEAGGNTEYREGPDDDNPLSFKLSAAETGEVFGLAEKLGYFERPLEFLRQSGIRGDQDLPLRKTERRRAKSNSTTARIRPPAR